ncbi:hypothetical protein [Scytonema sp. NUACC26]
MAIGDWGLAISDWRLAIGDWGLLANSSPNLTEGKVLLQLLSEA